jgi:hypothetical protein
VDVLSTDSFVSFGTHTSNDNTCPNNIAFTTINSKTYCCPGTLTVFNPGANFNSQTDFDSQAVCCVGGENNNADSAVSFCPGFPFCSGTAMETPVSVKTMTPPSCVTKIPVSASDYTSLVVGAASSLSESGSATGVVTTTASVGGETTTSSRGTSTSTVTAQSSTSSGLGAPAVTGRTWIKGCVGAGAVMAVVEAL